MSSVDGSERPTDKLLSEGDKELTHMCYRMDENEAFTIFEERRNGVSIGTAVTYLNKRLKLFLEENEDIEDEFQIWASIIPPDDFITALGRINRISSAELFVEKKVIGSGYLNLMEIDANTNEDLSIVVKAKPRKTLQKRAIESVYRTLTTQGTEVQRIRVRGKDIDRMNVTIDSLNGKKADEVLVELNQNGVVDSYVEDNIQITGTVVKHQFTEISTGQICRH